MAIKSITEFTIQPGRRGEFIGLFESLVAQNMSTLRDAGCSEATLWAVVDDPDKAVEIADWESGQARDAAIQSEAFGVFARMFELLAGAVTATVVEPLHWRTSDARALGALHRRIPVVPLRALLERAAQEVHGALRRLTSTLR